MKKQIEGPHIMKARQFQSLSLLWLASGLFILDLILLYFI